MAAKTIMCYSYKGGTGRSTGAANIAAAMAKQGKNVCLIDMDVEGPGLHEIFEIEELPSNCIQSYIRSKEIDTRSRRILVEEPIGLNEYLSSGVIDLAEKFSTVKEKGGKFLFLPADPNIQPITFKGRTPEERLRRLLFALESKQQIDYFFLDGASGMRSSSLMPMSVSDLVLVFFRWTKQHLAGTIFSASWIKEFKNNPRTAFKADFLLIPSVIPDVRTIEETEGSFISNLYQLARKRLLEGTGASEEILERCTIPEYSILKWKEDIIVFETENTAYEDIANTIISKFSSNEA